MPMVNTNSVEGRQAGRQARGLYSFACFVLLTVGHRRKSQEERRQFYHGPSGFKRFSHRVYARN
jgi:hypothetical protein